LISRADIRATARRARRLISPQLQAQRALLIARHVFALRQLRPRQKIAAYLPVGPEADTRPLLRGLLTRDCGIYLPRIESWRGKRLSFIAINSGPLRRNFFGIAEPRGTQACKVRWMNIVLLPLVAFDSAGNRLGSGAGFYDRALSFRRLRKSWRGPLLLGLAHSEQQVDRIEPQLYDVPLDGVITELGLTMFARKSA
jgi:5-formyltetrahydrofolate cyclo-ligase